MKIVSFLVLLFLAGTAAAEKYYVSNSGADSNNGTSVDSPFLTIPKAVSVMQAGDTVLLRGGVHPYSSTITLSKNGTVSARFHIMAFDGERPVLDFKAQPSGKRGISLTGSYWLLKGFDVRYAADNGLNISGGGNNIIENCAFYENKDTGVQLGAGAHDNHLINCDSYYNADPTDYGDADGFAPKLDVGSNNKFTGCRAWGNCDDGWDGYMRGATNVTTILENCWTWGNGWLKDGTDPGSQANGNGFKMGGGDNGNSANLMHHFFLSNCVAFNNKAKGFDQNNNAGSMQLYNCSGYGNLSANYRIKRELAAGQTLTVKNCVSFNGTVDLGSFAIQATNSWMGQFSVSTADFQSIDTTGMGGPRKSDGSLPDVPFLKLVQGSDLIDAGTNVGLDFSGQAPDLGAFEYENLTSVNTLLRNDTKMWFSGDQLHVDLEGNDLADHQLFVYSVTGSLLIRTKLDAGEALVNCSALNRGIYIVKLTGDKKRISKKVVKL